METTRRRRESETSTPAPPTNLCAVWSPLKMARCSSAVANLCCLFVQEDPSPPAETLGILAFDAAKTMCRLLSLYHSLTDHEILRLRRHVLRSRSLSRLNSADECFLLSLACAERLEDLHLAAAAVSRLSSRCSSPPDTASSKHDFASRDVQRKIDAMEKLVASTRSLHRAMESLAEMEASERKLQRWRNVRANHGLKVKVECFADKILFHQRQILYFKQVSLWNQTFDKVVSLMARITSIVYNRICSVFGSIVTGVVPAKHNKPMLAAAPNFENCVCRVEHRDLYRTNLCLFDKNEDSVKKHGKKGTPTANGVFQLQSQGDSERNNRVYRLAPVTTVGGAGLSLRYANVIMLAERCMHVADGAVVGDEVRVALYEMLPERLKVKLHARLRRERLEWRKMEVEGEEDERSRAAAQHLVAAEGVMEWLLPVAHNMVRWQAERNLEKQKFETRPTVLLMQTLHYSDLEKVEEGIVEALVGLSYMFWNRKQS
ncbi:hypothetical protein Fmac_011019 [Flemingia macrophylla]|uniref:Uncharacterized protein n=1 Tax=Flemingia macrophylla TaxID=520843 RepID=A0ABD1MM34_9FABA